MLSVLLALMAVAGVSVIFVGLNLMVTQPAMKSRLDQYAVRPRTLEELELEEPFAERMIKPLIGKIARFLSGRTPQQTMAGIQQKLVMAGNPRGWTAMDFLGIKGAAAIVVAFLAFFLLSGMTSFPMPFVGALGGALLGFYFPEMYLGQLIGGRQKQITKALPDVLDLLTISVEAGLGFDAALAKVTQKWDNALTREFSRVLTDMRLGKPRREALRGMADRTEVPEVSNFISALIQADQLGVSISKILSVQSEQMRLGRRQRAEEEAHKAPIKMMFPMVFLIFPSVFLIILGPAVPQIMESMGGK